MERNDGRLYRLDPLDDTGAFLGLTTGQCALVGTGLVWAVALLTVGTHIVVATLPIAATSAAAFARVGGRPLRERVAVRVRWLAGQERRRWQPTIPLVPATTDAGEERVAMPLPSCLEGVHIREVPWRTGSPIGAVADRQAATLTAVVPATGGEFLIHPRSDQDATLARWADVLAAFAANATPVAHLGWTDRSYPSGLDEHRAWIDTIDRAGDTDSDAARSYEELLAGAASHAAGHDTVLFVTVARHRLTRRAQHDPDGLDRALTTSIDTLLRALRSADLAATDPDTPVALRRRLRTHLTPHQPHTGAVPAGAEGPLDLETSLGHVRIDGCVHRSFWVAGYPRLPQPAGWLEPFLAAGGVSRTLTVYFRPVPTHESRRQIERDLVKLESDAQTRTDKGRRVDARHRRATQTLLDREEELIAGHPELGYAALLTVTATTTDQLAEHCEILEQHARQLGLDLRPFDARHDLAWAATLPFGLAPRSNLL